MKIYIKLALKILYYLFLGAGILAMCMFIVFADEARYGYHAGGVIHPLAEQFYATQKIMTIIFVIAAIASFIAVAIKPIKPKVRYIAGAVITVPLMVASITILVIDVRHFNEQIRVSALETVNQNVDLWHYDPFRENTKTVSLPSSETATLRLSDNLPRLDGATAFYPIYSAFVQAVYPIGDYSDYQYDHSDFFSSHHARTASGIVSCTTTPVAYERLINDETDIIFVLGISAEHAELAEEKGVELEFTPIGKEAFVFFVNSNNPVSSLTSEQIRQIYSGEITDWSGLGGKNKPIRAYQRNVGSGSQTAFLEFVGDINLIESASDDIFEAMMGIINHTAYRNHDNAIGYSFRHFATEMAGNDSITLLEIDGIEPTRENIENGTYPLVFDFYAVTRADRTNPNTDKLVEWIQGEQGRYLIEKTGYVAY